MSAAGPPPRAPQGGPPSLTGEAGPAVSRRRRRVTALPVWWSPGLPARQVLLGLAATPGPLPSVIAARLAAGEDPASQLCADSPEPGLVAARLDALGIRLLLPGDPGWPFASAPPDPPCAWLFVAGQDPPAATASVAVVGGRRASTLRRAAARSLAKGLAGAGLCVVSGGAVGIDAAAHDGTLDGGGRTVVVLGCGLDVPYPRGNLALFARVRAAGGTLLGEHPPGARPLAANFLPRNRLIAALSSAVVVVGAASESGSLFTARAAGSRGAGRVLAVPGAPWDPGAAGCNDLIRDGAILVRGLDDVLEALGTSPSIGRDSSGGGMGREPQAPPERPGRSVPPAPGPTPAARMILQALADGQVLGLARLAAVTGLAAPAVASALLELELSGLVRRSAAGAEAVALPTDA
jgi:DNA processing protein